MIQDLISKSIVTINTPIDRVWAALTMPEIIKEYMFGTTVVSDWRVGSSIIWKGEWQGKPYEDKGKILQLDKNKLLQYSHFSPLSGKPDAPENYHTVTIELNGSGSETSVALTQDGNPTEDAREHSQKNWDTVLNSLKELLEKPQAK